MREALRSPNEVLNSLRSKSKETGYRYQRLYRNLYNPNFYLLAYQNIYNNGGSMTKGVDGQTLDGMGMERINRIIPELRDSSYQPSPIRRQHIPKANGQTRPRGLASADDMLVQEVVRLLLEAIYEPQFSNCSHGFRPGRSCHTALTQVQRTYTGVKWFVEGGLNACLDTIDPHIWVGILRKRIQDEAFLGLIWKFLRAGYLDNWVCHPIHAGAAQGSILSPILVNVYLNELDCFMADYKERFDKGGQRSDPAAVRCYESDRRIAYCRYAGDFLIGVIGSKAEAEAVRDEVRVFLAERLKLALSTETMRLTHASKQTRFLGYDVTTSQPGRAFVSRNGTRPRRTRGIVKLYVPKETWVHDLLEKGVLRIQKDERGRARWMPVARTSFVNRTPVEIVRSFHAEIRGLYHDYALARNISVLSKYRYVMEYSMYKTFARKYRCTMVQAKRRFFRNGVFSVPCATPSGQERQIAFCRDGFRQKPPIRDGQPDCPHP